MSLVGKCPYQLRLVFCFTSVIFNSIWDIVWSFLRLYFLLLWSHSIWTPKRETRIVIICTGLSILLTFNLLFFQVCTADFTQGMWGVTKVQLLPRWHGAHVDGVLWELYRLWTELHQRVECHAGPGNTTTRLSCSLCWQVSAESLALVKTTGRFNSTFWFVFLEVTFLFLCIVLLWPTETMSKTRHICWGLSQLNVSVGTEEMHFE